MTIHDIGQAKLLPGWQLFPALRERLARLRAGEHLVTQRMAGAAFVIRVASAARSGSFKKLVFQRLRPKPC